MRSTFTVTPGGPAPVRRHRNHARRVHRPLRRHDVLGPVTGARADVARQGEVGQRSQSDVVGAADTALEHPAAPDRHRVVLAEVVDGLRLGEPPHPARLDVHDAPGAQGQHVLGGGGVRDRFVEADGRLEPVLQLRVAAEVVLRERLLDHQQAVGVQVRQVLGVAERVGAVGVGHQRRVRTERLARRADVLDVGPRPDLDLDLAVTEGQRVARLVDQRPRAVLDTDGDAGGDRAARAAQQPRQARPFPLGPERPGAHLDRRLRHRMAAEPAPQHAVDRVRVADSDAEGARRDPLGQRQPGGVDGLGREVRALAGDALAPGARAVGVFELEQQDPPAGRTAGRDLERLAQRHPDFPQRDARQAKAHRPSVAGDREDSPADAGVLVTR